jgi:uncharacterized coiled-coil protein SlyX
MSLETDVKALKKRVITLEKQLAQTNATLKAQERAITDNQRLATKNSSRLDNSLKQLNDRIHSASRAYDQIQKNFRALDRRLTTLEKRS